jgi:hypothetical protein
VKKRERRRGEDDEREDERFENNYFLMTDC